MVEWAGVLPKGFPDGFSGFLLAVAFAEAGAVFLKNKLKYRILFLLYWLSKEHVPVFSPLRSLLQLILQAFLSLNDFPHILQW